MNNDLLYQVSLTLIPNIGDVTAKTLINHFGNAGDIFKAKKKDLEKIDGIGSITAAAIKKFQDFTRAEDEIRFIEKYNIVPLFIADTKYPRRLLNCYDSPVILYHKGNANLNAGRILAIVGTRNNNEYGRVLCEKLIDDISTQDILIVSGLAFGIDSIAHRAALKKGLHTVAVLAHGLDRIYPGQNKSMAKDIVAQGGLLTDFRSNTNPDKQNFPKRNRIVAGISDAVVVVESGIKGGSLITAELGNGYNRDVFAFPGRTNDAKSEGCNYLIKNNKACLVTSAEDIIYNMGWKEDKKPAGKKQRELFIELSNHEKIIVNIIRRQEQVHIDELYIESGLSSSAVAAALLSLEMQSVINSLPGKTYVML